jgi:hypothetical protein
MSVGLYISIKEGPTDSDSSVPLVSIPNVFMTPSPRVFEHSLESVLQAVSLPLRGVAHGEHGENVGQEFLRKAHFALSNAFEGQSALIIKGYLFRAVGPFRVELDESVIVETQKLEGLGDGCHGACGCFDERLELLERWLIQGLVGFLHTTQTL